MPPSTERCPRCWPSSSYRRSASSVDSTGVTRDWDRALQDLIAGTDTASGSLATVTTGTAADTAGATDATARVLDGSRTLGDFVDGVDTPAYTRGVARALQDAATASDAVVSTLTGPFIGAPVQYPILTLTDTTSILELVDSTSLLTLDHT